MDKYIVCTVGTSIANDCLEQKVLFKSQTGWEADGTVIKRQLAESIKKRSPDLKPSSRNFRALCAELNTLDRLENRLSRMCMPYLMPILKYAE